MKEKFKSIVLGEFWKNYKNDFEDYLKRLEIDWKIFVWRSGVLEDVILSFDNFLEINDVFSLIS